METALTDEAKRDAPMTYLLLGNSGLRVSETALGTMTFGEDWGWGSDPAESRRVLDYYIDRGGNFIDTANFYTEGTSETLIGQFLEGRRSRVVLSSKYSCVFGGKATEPNEGGNHRKSLVQALDATLKRLRTDYLDLYHVHAWDFLTPVEEVMRTLDDQVRAGKILYAGVSNAPAWIVAHANTLAAGKGWTPFVATQIQYHLGERTADRELLPMARALDVGVTSWSPLAGGVLTGKYDTNASKYEGQFKRSDVFPFVPLDERTRHIATVVAGVAQRIGRPASQVALAWVRSQGVIPIVGARTVEQLRENLGYSDLVLDVDALAALNEATAIEGGYPSNFLAAPMGKTALFGGLDPQIRSHRPQWLPEQTGEHTVPRTALAS